MNKHSIAGFFRTLRIEEDGAAASEYAIVVGFVAVAVAAAASQFNLTEVFPAVVAKISSLVG